MPHPPCVHLIRRTHGVQVNLEPRSAQPVGHQQPGDPFRRCRCGPPRRRSSSRPALRLCRELNGREVGRDRERVAITQHPQDSVEPRPTRLGTTGVIDIDVLGDHARRGGARRPGGQDSARRSRRARTRRARCRKIPDPPGYSSLILDASSRRFSGSNGGSLAERPIDDRFSTPRARPPSSSTGPSPLAYGPLRGLVQDGPVAAGGLGFVQGGVGGEQRVVVGRRARVEEHATDADGGMNPTGTSVV